MIYTEHKRIYNEIDEIDHLTRRYRRGGEIPPAEAARLILRYRALEPEAEAALALPETLASTEALAAAPQETLNALLVRVRTVLMQKAGLLKK